jgi:hypothetical protein
MSQTAGCSGGLAVLPSLQMAHAAQGERFAFSNSPIALFTWEQAFRWWMKLQTVVRRYRVNRKQISFIKFILEAYDNVAAMSTLDRRMATIRVAIAPGCETLVDGIMNGLASEIDVVPVANPVDIERKKEQLDR